MNGIEKRHTHPLLVVEDNDADFVVLERLMTQMAVQNPVYRCTDGDEALDYMYREGDYQTPELAPRPGVVLLDLNLPGTDGREVLEHLKRDPKLYKIPVVIFTTSQNPLDIDFCYHHGANSYLIKPMDFNQLQTTVQTFVEYWLSANVQPQIPES